MKDDIDFAPKKVDPSILKEFEGTAAVSRQPHRGKCSNSCFADGFHRIGLFPVYFDKDATPGFICRYYCIQCGKRLNPNPEGFFIFARKEEYEPFYSRWIEMVKTHPHHIEPGGKDENNNC
jgi:hypothetical protein